MEASSFGSFDDVRRPASSAELRRRATPARTQSNALPEFDASGASGSVGVDLFGEQARSDALKRSLVALEAAYYEDFGKPLSAPSRAGLLAFDRYCGPASMPLLGAEDDGSVVATWDAPVGCLTIRFVDRLRFHFALAEGDGLAARRHWGPGYVLDFMERFPLAKQVVCG